MKRPFQMKALRMNNGTTLVRLRPPIIRIHSLVKYTQFEQLGIQSLWIKTSLCEVYSYKMFSRCIIKTFRGTDQRVKLGRVPGGRIWL